jgi:diguanylate cyclase (GGDEF)-like protein/PAS domain S-box-containing protein
MKQLPRRAQAYVLGVIGLAAVLLCGFGQLPRRDQLPTFFLLTFATVLTSTFKLRLPTTKNRATMSVSFVIDFASLLLIGPHKTMLIAAMGAVSQSTLRVAHRNPPHRVLFNVSVLVITVQAAGVIYRVAGGNLAPLEWPTDAAAIVAAVSTFFLVNSGAIALAVALSTYQPLRRVWSENFLWGGPSYFVGAAVSGLIAEIIGKQLWTLVPVAAIPLYVTFRAYRAFAGRLEDEHRHREVIESLNEGMAVVQSDGRIALWNDALERIMGVPRERAIGRTLVDAVPELAATMVPHVIRAVLESGRTESIEHLAIHRAGARRILQVRVFVFMNGVTVFWNDITERAEAEAALKQSEERYALAAAGSNDGLWDWDLARDEVYWSPRWKEMLGLPADRLVSRPEQWYERIHRDDLQSFQAALRAHIAGETSHFQHEFRIRHEDGAYRRMLCRGVAVRAADGRAMRIAGSQTDVTERAAAQEQLRHAALHDALTGLPNRALFIELLGQVIDRRRRHPECLFAVLFLDVDRFKVLNDSLGHVIGDELLIGVSRRLEACMRQGDTIARLGGDEFTILLNDLSHTDQATAVAERTLDALREPFAIRGREIFVTASVGIALSHGGYKRPDQVMRDADTAMYRAKALGKARFELFDASMHTRAMDRLSLEVDLRRAIERGEFALHYQPIVSLRSGQWTGFEALLRWQRGGCWISPAEFVPVIEEMGLIESLGAWVIQEACRQMAVWRAQFPNGRMLGVTVNVSARQLARSDFVETVRSAIGQSNLEPGDLRVEITETTLMENPDRAEVVLRELRAMGVKVYLDDFGTGFSSLSYLHRFPVDTLKIDRSFIACLAGRNHQPAFVESIVALARTIGTQVIAEGVETEAQMDELVRIGCGEAQGFLFAGALPPDRAEALLACGDGSGAFAPRPRTVPVSVIIH